MADQPCNTCAHYDPILRGTKPTRLGWCVKKSVYPHTDSPGQVTPANAQRAANPDDLAKPHLVEGTGVQKACMLYTPKQNKPTKADLLSKATKR